jgi:hypothetical protein
MVSEGFWLSGEKRDGSDAGFAAGGGGISP